MPQTIIFDTNYLRSFSQNDYLAGKLPEKLRKQISLAVARGDLVALVDTVRIETNAWLELGYRKKQDEIRDSIERLKLAGYSVSPESVIGSKLLDFFDLLKLASRECTLIAPSIEDYKEAERRTSYRLAPHPQKAEGEEMRDRVIWCQALRLSRESNNPVLIVSGDTLFKNGAISDEGISARIKVVEAEADLDQQLGERPSHIVELINSLLVFAPELVKYGINLTADAIQSVEELRKVQERDGSVTQRFLLLTLNVKNLEAQCAISLNSMMNQPRSIHLLTTPPITLVREIAKQEHQSQDWETSINAQDRAMNELRQLIRNH